ncbi:MAG: DinB family protein [Dethiobacter sp.]|nr:DinB family protein [Dethiobacter sp.]
MEQSLFDQMNYLRQRTITTVKDLSDKEANAIPEGFNNNILWNTGHICLIQEQLVFAFAKEPMGTPDDFPALFAMGTKPSEWASKPPALSELIQLLQEQPVRIQERLKNRLNDTVALPFVIPGLKLQTFAELLTFTFYHEGTHIQAIKMLKKINELQTAL